MMNYDLHFFTPTCIPNRNGGLSQITHIPGSSPVLFPVSHTRPQHHRLHGKADLQS